MKDLLEKVLPYLPHYLAELGSVLVGPKQFIARKDVGSDDAFVQSLVFVAVSLTLGVAMTMPLYPNKELWARVSAVAVGYLVGGALMSLALRVAWRAVGGHVSLRSFFVSYAYLYGAWSMLLAVLVLLFAGAFRAFEPEIYARFLHLIDRPLSPDVFRESLVPDGASRATAMRMLWILLVFLLGHLGLVIWALVAWGAFRELNGLSRRHSLGALAITAALAVPAFVVTVFVTNAMP